MSKDNENNPVESINPVLNEKFIGEITTHFRGSVANVVVDVHDRGQFVRDVTTAAERLNANIVHWNADVGLHYYKDKRPEAMGVTDTTHPVEALKTIQKVVMEGKEVPSKNPELGRGFTIYMMRNFQDCWSGMAWGMGRPMKVNEQIITLTPVFEAKTCMFVFYGPTMKVPDTLVDDVQRLDYTYPGKDALKRSFEMIHASARQSHPNIKAPSEELVESAIAATQGLYTHKARQAFTLGIIKSNFDYSNEEYISDVAAERRKYIKESGLVDLITPRGGFETIGGLVDAKNMVSRDLEGLRPEAREFGMDKPNGMLLGGGPGGGKSAFAAAIGGEFGLDILQVSANKILHSHLGKSEENLSKILRLPELYQGAGCLLYFEECDKLFGSFSSKGDDSTAGTGMRLLGTMLTYFQDRQYNPNDNAYIVGTFNDGSKMDDALLRPGRFNSKAWVGLPDAKGREEILSIHLSKRKRNAADYPISKLVEMTDNFSGAELEAIIVDVIKRAYCDKLRNGYEHKESELILEVASKVSPQAIRSNSDYEKQKTWAEESGFMSATVDVTAYSETNEQRGIIEMPKMKKISEKKLKKKEVKDD
jgi:SpoVK/Ycf46/Vps4 family AAA+-type ATPase